MRRVRAFFRALIPDPDVRALALELPLIALASLALGLVLYHRPPDDGPAWARARALTLAGDPWGAEVIYRGHLRRGPVTVPLLIDFLDNHALLAFATPAGAGLTRTDLPRQPRQGLSDTMIEQLLEGPSLSSHVKLLGRFYWQVTRDEVDAALQSQVDAAADAEPPTAWANHVLALQAQRKPDLGRAAERFGREGINFRARREDATRALAIWAELERWDVIGRKLKDPRWDAVADPQLRHEYALRQGRWKEATRWLLVANLRPETGPLLLALVAGLMWFAFVARLGKLKERPVFRGGLYVVAFALGALSVVPTLLLATFEESVLNLRETGELARDAVYFIGGVGLREELSKLLLFAPLLPVLRRYGTRLDVLACGAMVGLGFAVEENLGYFASGLGGAVLGRFLTANFMHIAMTAVCAEALDDLLRDPERRSLDFTVTFLTVVVQHGVYDLFAASPALMELSFLSMTVFILLTRQWITAVSHARGRADANDRFVRRLVQAIAVVASASFVYACAMVGPGPALGMVLIGLLGDAIIVFVCVQQMRRA